VHVVADILNQVVHHPPTFKCSQHSASYLEVFPPESRNSTLKFRSFPPESRNSKLAFKEFIILLRDGATLLCERFYHSSGLNRYEVQINDSVFHQHVAGYVCTTLARSSVRLTNLIIAFLYVLCTYFKDGIENGNMKCPIFWDRALCNPVKVNWRLRGTSPPSSGSKSKRSKKSAWSRQQNVGWLSPDYTAIYPRK
jgi:hypothetical protein